MSESHLLISRTTESTKEQQFLRTEQIETVLRHYYPDHGSSLPDYLQEGIPEVQEYTIGYQTSTSTHTNGHGNADAPSFSTQSQNSQSTAPVDSASLISRNTSQTKTQQVKTITKIIKTREVLHGPDGKPMYSPFGGSPDYLPYPTNTSEFDYGTYDPGRPPSPAGQTPQEYEAYGTYGQTASPGSAGRNFELYPQPGEPYSEYGFRPDIPTHTQTVTTPSGASDSPNLHRAMPQAPPTRAPQYNQPANYEDIDASSGLVPPPRCHPQDYRRTPPSPTQSDRYATGTYGYTGQPPLPATSPGYEYDAGLPEGYLDRRPSFDDPNATYAHAPRQAYEEESRSDGPVPPRHPHLEYAPVDSEGDVRWRDPDLHEVIDFLKHPNNVVKANAAAYLQHLTYNDDAIKAKTRSLGGIPPLIEMLNNDIPEIATRNALGALRNLSYGRKNDENKRAICQADGINALVRLLKKTPDNEVRQYDTGILWNLSSCEDLKRPILDDALTVLVNNVIIPHSGYDRSRNPLGPIKQPTELYFSTVFRNASGVIRNISSAGEYARKKLRVCEGLIESLVYLVRAALSKGDMDNKAVENSVGILRNLSYRIQEIDDPNYDKHYPPAQSRATGPIRAVDLGCFGAKKKKENSSLSAEKQERREGVPLTKNPIGESDYIGGVQLLWQPEVCHCYLSLLSESANQEVLEASAGAIMNLCACYWRPSIEIRASVRMDKGLPILVELLRLQNDRVVSTVATALLNLSKDSRNKDLIGNYAMKDLVLKLPSGGVCDSPQNEARTSDDTIAAVLATLNEVVVKQSDFARSLIQLGGVERLTQITTSKNVYSTRVVKFASLLLFNMWQHTELREPLKRAGWKESHFLPKGSLATRNSLSSSAGANNILGQPVGSTGATKYEDGTLPHGTELNSSAAGVLSYSRSEELPLSELSHSTEPPPSSQIHRPPHMGVFPPGMQQARSPTEPVYAQVNREKKKGRHSDIPVQLLPHSDNMPAGDSWV